MLVKFFATYRDITKCPKIELAAPADVLALLRGLSARYGPAMREKLLTPDGEAVGRDAIVLVNGRNISHMEGVATAISEEDVVAVFPLIAGG